MHRIAKEGIWTARISFIWRSSRKRLTRTSGEPIRRSRSRFGEEVKKALKAEDFSKAQAEAFSTQWSVVTHQPNTESSYSSTLFKNTEGQYVLAFRGTEGLFSRDLWQADAADIVYDGLAIKQIVDLYNDWVRMNVPAGAGYPAAHLVHLAAESAAYVNATLLLGDRDPEVRAMAQEAIDALKARQDVIFDGPGLAAYSIEFVDSRALFSDERRLGTGLMDGKTLLAVTGHSLGGHLASAFSRLFPWADAQALTINGAGYPMGTTPGLGGNALGNIDNLFRLLGGRPAFDTGLTQNLYGEKGPELVTMNQSWGLVQPGSHIPVFIESAGVGTTLGHEKGQMTDSLAVYDLLIQLDANLRAGPPQQAMATLAPILQAGANTVSFDLEGTVNAVADFFSSSRKIASGEEDERDPLYQAIGAIRTTSEYEDAAESTALAVRSLAGLSADAVVAGARTDVAYRYALQHLSPFALTGNEAVYAAHNAAGQLDRYDGATRTGSLTDAYLDDRARMLQGMLARNLANTAAVPPSVGWASGSEVYYDHASDTHLRTSAAVGPLSPPPGAALCAFGDGQPNALVGGDQDDRLYAGAGDDTLRGNAGNDYLEGGAGSDSYVCAAGGGFDTILDTDGSGRIEVDGVALTGGARVAEGIWVSADGKHSFAFDGDLQAGGPLVVDGRIRVEGFRNQDLGVVLGADAPFPPASHVLAGTAAHDSLWVGDLIVNPPAGFGEPLRADGGTGNDCIGTAAGDDSVDAGDGNDWIVAYAGDDAIQGGAGNDAIFPGAGTNRVDAGDGDDVVVSSHYRGFNTSGDVTWDEIVWQDVGWGFAVDIDPEPRLDTDGELDFVYTLLAAPAALSGASVSPELQFSYRPVAGGTGVIEYSYPGSGDSFEFTVGHERFGSVDTRPNYLSGGAGNDFLAGNAGDDVLLGGADDDRLVGGPGTDALLGGTGRDVLLGQQGDDYIEGGGQADRAYGGSGRDEVHGGDGNDELYGDTDDAHPGDDDRLHGEAGDDRLWGNAGNDALCGGEGNDYLAGDDGTATGTQHGDDYLHGGTGQDTLVGGGGRDELIGGDGDDFLHGDDHPSQPIGAGLHGDDYLSGGQGDDNLFGDGGNDVLAGGPGQDAMEGGPGDDTYLLGPSDGPVVGGIAESIDDTAGDDTIVFTGSLSATGMSVLRGGADLIVRYAPDDWVYVNDGFAGSIESFAFADGRRLSWTRFVGTAYGQPVTASTAEPGGMMVGGALGDVLEATGGGSTFSGGLGADTLIGAGGNNVYLYDIGDGTDRIHDTGGQLDAEGNPAPNRLRFGAGIAPEDLRLSVGSLAIRVGANPIDVIHLDGFDPGNVHGSRAIDLFEFADGRVLSYEELVARGFDIEGTEGYDVLVGTNVDDRIAGGPGDDLLRGGDGNDVYLYGRGDGHDTLDDTAADASVDTLRLGAGILSSDLILRRSADDLLVQVRDGADEVVVQGHFAGAPIDRIELADGTAWDTTQILSRLSSELTEGPDAYFGTTGPDHVDGRGGNDVLTGGGGDDELAGGSGSDTLRGEDGDDVLAGDGEDDWLYGGAGDDVLGGGAGNDRLEGGPGSDVYLFGRGAGQDRLSQWDGDAAKVDAVQLAWDVAPSEVTVTRTGDDLVLGIGGTADTLTVAGHFWNDAGVPGYRVEEIRFADGTVWDAERVRAAVLAGTDAAQTITGYAGADVIDAGGGADVVYGRGGDDTIGGGSGDDTLQGEEGDDVLDGGAGNDRLDGGPGNDTYRFGYGGGQDTIDEWDTAPGKIATLRLGDGVMPDSVSLQRLGGSEDGLRLHLLDAGGAPTGDYVHLQGYFVSADASRRVDRIELGNGVVWSYADLCSMLLAPTAGADTLAGFATDDVVDGLAGNDSINGKSGNDVLLGGEGDDDLQGGLGNDRLFGGPGNDRLLGYGVWPDDAATVNSEPGDDLLHGGPGNDTLFGGQGNDVYLFERGDGSDTIGETPNTSGASTDVLRFGDGILPEDVGLYRTAAGLVFVVDGSPTQISVSNYYAAHDAQVERVELDGGKGPVWTAADIAARTDQGTPNAMTGTAADDVFLVDHEGDTIAEASGGGTDTAYASRSYVLPSNVENLTLTGPLNVNATGNALANVLRGNSGNNVLDGKDGSDSAYGGPGDDIYRNVEVVVENPGEGTDTWVNRYGGTLPANVENLYLDDGSGQHSASTVSAIGNALDNTLVSSGLGVGGDVLDGRAGADTMIAKGWDSVVFYVDDPGDRVIASPTGQLSDEVRSYVDCTLPAHVEKLTLLGSAAIQGFGNDADNVLDGSQNAAGNCSPAVVATTPMSWARTTSPSSSRARASTVWR